MHIENAPGLAPCIKAVARLQSAAIDTRKNNRRYKQKTPICTVIGISEFFFAFSTILGWHFFGAINVKHLFGQKGTKIYSMLVVVFIIIGSTLKVDLVWSLADFFNGLMVIPNALALLALSGVVVGISKKAK